MKKIPTIFKRNPENMRELLQVFHDDCGWVFKGEGVATRKYDGTCCRVKNGILYRRREIKKGSSSPLFFELADYDEITGKTVGWMPISNDKSDQWHLEAFVGDFEDGTYELCGKKIQGNPENYEHHTLIAHSTAEKYENIERTFAGIRDFLSDKNIEGLVFHHFDGRMAKIKKRDFGQKR